MPTPSHLDLNELHLVNHDDTLSIIIDLGPPGDPLAAATELNMLEVNKLRNFLTDWIANYRRAHNVQLNSFSKNEVPKV